MPLISLKTAPVRSFASVYGNHLLGLLTVTARSPLPLKEPQALSQVRSMQAQVG